MNIHHIELGKGKAVIFLHGFCETSEIWRDFVTPLSADYRTLLPDLPGFGKSPLPLEVSLEQIANHLWRWCDAIKVENPIIIGHSLGGYIALAMAKLRPQAVAGLVLFHSTSLADSEEKKLNREKTYDFVKLYGASAFLDNFIPSIFFKQEPELLDKFRKIAQQTDVKTILEYTLAMRDRPSYETVIQKINIPILFLGGEEDQLIPTAALALQAKALKTSELVIISGIGHMGMLENPAACSASIADFLSQF